MTAEMTAAKGRTVRLMLGAGPSTEHATGRCNDLTDEQLGAVATHVGGELLAADALKMRPWPAWMMDVLFPGRKSRP